MGNTYYAQSNSPAPTMTVGQLIEKLQAFDAKELVIFRSPEHGCFGPNNEYSLDTVQRVHLPREEHLVPASEGIDEEGEPYSNEAYTDVLHAWSGVVIG